MGDSTSKRTWLSQLTSKKRKKNHWAGGFLARLVEDDSALPCGCFKRSRPRSDVPGLDKKHLGYLGLLRSETMIGSWCNVKDFKTRGKMYGYVWTTFGKYVEKNVATQQLSYHTLGK